MQNETYLVQMKHVSRSDEGCKNEKTLFPLLLDFAQ